MDTGNTGFMMICAALVFIMTPGLAFFYGGLVRRKNVEYSCAGVPLFRRNGYRQSGGRKPLFRNRDTALN